MENSACKLCIQPIEKTGNLCQSHIIPKFMLKKSKLNGKSIMFEGNSIVPKLDQFDWKEKMLCSTCEQKIKYYEDFINKIFFSQRDNRVLSENISLVRFSGSNDLMALAMLSIFWRATQAQMPEFRFAIVPEMISSELRLWLLNRTIPRNWEHRINISIQMILDGAGRVMPFILTPRIRQLEKKFEYIFAFAGYFVIFTIPPEIKYTENRKYRIRQGSQILRIEKVYLGQIPEIASIIIPAKEREENESSLNQ